MCSVGNGVAGEKGAFSKLGPFETRQARVAARLGGLAGNPGLKRKKAEAFASARLTVLRDAEMGIRSKRLPHPYSMRTSGLVEVGAYCINNLRRSPRVEFHCWKPISGIPKPETARRKPKPDRMRLPVYYQSLLDSGEVKTRAELARFLGVSRARVTQVLNRLK